MAFATKPTFIQSGVVATNATSVAANTAGVICNTPCTITTILIQTNLPLATSVYDNSTGAGGDVIFVVPASQPAGTIYTINAPAANGVYWGGATNSPAVRINYVKQSVGGV